jgi:tubulin epsilon
MPREIISVQVGQCGNQIGMRFWDLALREHASRGVLFDDSMSSFFKFEENGTEIPTIKARSLVVDMEEGVINQLLKSDIGELFDDKQFIKDVSGAGNNWAHGFYEYGSLYSKLIIEKLHKILEECDSPQCFMLMHSIGGGTGSGLGSYIVKTLNEEYSDLYKFTVSVFPSKDDDVITSPYNSILSLNQLINNADCVLPIDNQALIDICNKVDQETKKSDSKIFKNKNILDVNEIKNKGKNIININTNMAINDKAEKKPYDKMNSIIAHLLCNLTCSMRFEGSLNVDINDITMNLVPFPRLHFMLSSVSPLFHVLDKKLEPRRVDQIFYDVFNRDHHLISVNSLSSGVYLASALIARGNLSISDININLAKQKKQLKMINWNQEGFKIGLCDQPPVNMNYGLLCLSNNTAIADCFEELRNRFNKLYKKKAHIHHYTEYMQDKTDFDRAIGNVEELIEDYRSTPLKQPEIIKKINPII